MQQVIIAAGGSPSLWPVLDHFSEEAIWIGVDRGSLYLLNHGIQPLVAIGDFDSLIKEEFEQVARQVKEVIKAQPEKDFTDTELAILEVLKRYPDSEITLIGASGGRWDHFLANIWLPFHIGDLSITNKLTIADNQNTMRYFLPGDYVIDKEIDKKYLAFICLTPIEGFTIHDAKYKLTNVEVAFPTSYASNEFVSDTVRFSFTKGVIAVIQSKDK
ncbi:thiamine diphosphokinase [Vagococcus xieshaowenii]|uniref:Thiamine diphosphokinase n=1 Tax=Vagococcus xieshaowenii TaxID=2562451 RepID=A0AAJ5EED7_9ENTE|nr:thiamine diphosphokinase [Vagococcus xieshaowenii]QCA28928.1 thiamine diphosphokinase [Vagococcus xieshaowenii]TFZ39259.1 thiamine diphosphokinase [Vagococcus xieshaowenii]